MFVVSIPAMSVPQVHAYHAASQLYDLPEKATIAERLQEKKGHLFVFFDLLCKEVLETEEVHHGTETLCFIIFTFHHSGLHFLWCLLRTQCLLFLYSC